MIIGAHVSTSGGWDKACQRVHDLGCNGMQIFTGSPMMWRVTPADRVEGRGFSEARKKWSIEYVVVHATYLVNLASDRLDLVTKSREVLVNDLKINAKCGLDGLVVHLGSHTGRGYEAVRDQLVAEIKAILEATPTESRFLIENSAGQKGKIASNLEEIEDLLNSVDSDRLGWCLDTCHAHSAGYHLQKNSKFEARNSKQSLNSNFQDNKQKVNEQMLLLGEDEQKRNIDSQGSVASRYIIDEMNRLGLWDRLWCIHVNESRDPFGSGRDRHANLGEGEIGNEALGEFLNHPKIKSLPLILEVPGFEKQGPDRKNVERLKRLLIRA